MFGFFIIAFFVYSTFCNRELQINTPIYAKNTESSTFSFQVPKTIGANETLFVTVTPLGGVPFLFCSMGTSKWNAIDPKGIQIVAISGNDPGLQPGGTLSIEIVGAPNSLYFGIHAHIRDASYFVQVKESHPLIGAVEGFKWEYFEMTLKAGEYFVGTTGIHDSSDVVICLNEGEKRPKTVTPEECWKWDLYSGSVNLVHFTQSEASKKYTLGVYGNSLSSIFSVIVAGQNSEDVLLSDAFYTSGFVNMGMYQNYVYYWPLNDTKMTDHELEWEGKAERAIVENHDIVCDLTLFMSYTANPTKEKYDYKSYSKNPNPSKCEIKLKDHEITPGKERLMYLSLYNDPRAKLCKHKIKAKH